MPRKADTYAQRLFKKHGGRAPRDRLYDQKRKNDPAKRIRSSANWQKFMVGLKIRYPLCCDPFKTHQIMGDVAVPTRQGHHMISLASRPDLAYDRSNVAPLCVQCHAKIEAMERKGQWTRHLFIRFRQTEKDKP